ncbi:hypothetical protein [Streptomyces flavofungini]|uniref:Secreted protein n=1 Tax=Streptomyces flavofungini TaxID=68200 RepID=A0ABS0X5F2_9ACTN|nr:hypothetical protein [Streptomyces flavofungini]MBJ3808422.1 hypothetical protein [Streptomyces flavofungini]
MLKRTKTTAALAVAGTALLMAPFTTGHAAAAAPTAQATAPAAAQARAACEHGGPHTDFKGTSIHMRNKPGGSHVGWANQGDCAYWYQADPGPRVQCPDGSHTVAWQLVQNKRTGVVGYVSACFLG